MSSIMVRLKKIKRIGGDITCIAFVEDCEVPINIKFSVEDNVFYSDPLPRGYEWCSAHLRHARDNLEHMLKSGDIPEHRTIMWC